MLAFFFYSRMQKKGEMKKREGVAPSEQDFSTTMISFSSTRLRCELGRRYVQLKLFKMCDERGRTMNACGVDNCGSQLTGERGCLRALV